MPKYQITAQDGRTVTVEGDAAPTESDAETIFAQIKEAPKVAKDAGISEEQQEEMAKAATAGLPFKVPTALTKALLFTKAKVKLPVVGEVDVLNEAARLGAPIAGMALGGPLLGAGGGAVGESLAEVREIAQGDRQQVSPGKMLAATALGAFVPKPLQEGIGIGKAALTRGAQSLAIGEGALAGEKLLDEQRLPTLEEAISTGAVSFGAGSLLGSLEKGLPKLWNSLKGKQPAEAKAVVEASKELDDAAKKTLLQEIDESFKIGTPAKSAEESAQVLSAEMPTKSAVSSAKAFDDLTPTERAILQKEATEAAQAARAATPSTAEESAQVLSGNAPIKSARESAEAFTQAGDKMFASRESGSISPLLAGRLGGAGAGGAAGATYGYETGEELPPEKRLLRSAGYGLGGAMVGALAGGKLGQAAERGTLFRSAEDAKKSLLKEIKSENVGTESMPDWYRNWRQKPVIQKIREWNRSAITQVKDASDELAKQLGGDLPAEANPYSKASRLPGRIEYATKKGEEAFKTYSENVTNAAESVGLKPEDFRARLQEYQRAKYAPKVNAALRAKATEAEPYVGSGMTDEQAAAIIAKAKADGIDDVFDGLSSSYGDLVDMTRKALRDGGLISEKLYNKWKTEVPDYVPLQRILDDDLADDAIESIGTGLGGGPGRSVLSTGVKEIKGSERAVKDLDQTQLENWYDAVKRAETNKYGQSVLEMVNLAKGKDSSLSGVRVYEPKFGEQFKPNSMLAVYKDGKKYFVEFDNPVMAQAFNATNTEKMPWYVSIPARANQFLSGVFTRFNPDFFAIANPVRDAIEIAHKAASQGDVRGVASYLNPKKVGENAVAVWDWSHGNETEGAKLFDRLAAAGGLTGGYSGSTKNAAKAMIDRFRKDERNIIIQKKDDFVEFVDMLNQMSEGSNRLAAFKRALEAGATDEEAAMYARKASLDFNMKGSKTGALAAWKAFVNPTLQAPVNAAKNYVRNPALMAGTAATIFSFAALQDAINSQTDPEWRKKLGWENNNGIPFIFGKSDKGDLRVATIPLPQSLRPTKAVIDAMLSLSDPGADENTAADAGGQILASFVDNVMPLPLDLSSSKGFARTAAPTFAAPIVEAAVNQNYQGRDITPTYYSKDTAERVKTFPSFRKSEVGKMAIALSDEMAKAGFDINPQRLTYIARQYSGGPGKILLGTGMGDWGDVAKAVQSGEAPPVSSLPVVRSVIKSVPGEVVESKTQAYRSAQELKQQEETAKVEKSQQVFDAVDMLVEGNKKGDEKAVETAKASLASILDAHPDWAPAIRRSLMNAGKGYSATDNLIDSLGKKDGTRAKYIASQLAKLKDDDAKREYLMGLAEKELLDADVMRQVVELSTK